MRLNKSIKRIVKCNLFLIFKLRCAGAVLVEAEAALTTHNKILGIKRSQFAQCENKLTELREQKVIFD